MCIVEGRTAKTAAGIRGVGAGRQGVGAARQGMEAGRRRWEKNNMVGDGRREGLIWETLGLEMGDGTP